MNHAGKARRAAINLLLISFVILNVCNLLAFLSRRFLSLSLLLGILGVIWLLFAAFTIYFFRDPTAQSPQGGELIVAPAHGTVDVIDETVESKVMGGSCKRISIFLNVFNVHVQQSPIAGRVSFVQHTAGKFGNAIKTESAAYNENVLIGLDSKEVTGEKIAVRLIAGLIARRIIPFVKSGEDVTRGGRISLIQFGSRVDLYLPHSAQVKVKIGDKTVGGETIMAVRS